MIQAFNNGKRENFFQLWNRLVPVASRQYDLICQKLEFYIHIFFAMFPAYLGANPNKAQNNKDLRRELL